LIIPRAKWDPSGEHPTADNAEWTPETPGRIEYGWIAVENADEIDDDCSEALKITVEENTTGKDRRWRSNVGPAIAAIPLRSPPKRRRNNAPYRQKTSLHRRDVF
jgi:hypothetical protein